MNAIALNTTSTQASLLRRVLLADVVTTGTAGLLLTLAAGPLGDLFDLPVVLLRLAGLGLLPYTAFVLYVATRASIPRRGARVVIGLNLLWAITSLLLLVSGWVDPSALGIAFVVAQAIIVTAFADLQYLGLRRLNK
jgi:hypothetical protein